MNLRLLSAFVLILFTLGAAAQENPAATRPSWQPDPKLQLQLKNRKITWLFEESGVPAYKLPDPLLSADGTRITSARQWETTGRPQTLDLFSRHVYGRTPPAPAKVTFEILSTDPKALDGRATLKLVKITSADAAGKSFAFEAALLIPNEPPKPVPAFILINNRPVASADPSRRQKDGFWPAEEIIARGFAAAVFRTNDVDPDKKDDASRAQGVRGVWPAGGGTPGQDAWATIGAWAWGASRVLDFLLSENSIDPKKIAVIGHSRGGKTALWAAAQDQRFALAVSNDSGCGGAALKRRKFGETIQSINRAFPYWFCDNFKKFDGREEDLPVDQHQLIALIAPRAVYVASADADFWADQRGEFLSVAHSAPVFKLYNLATPKPEEMPPLESPIIRDHTAYHIRPGPHNLTPYDWHRFMDFADQLWRPKRP